MSMSAVSELLAARVLASVLHHGQTDKGDRARLAAGCITDAVIERFWGKVDRSGGPDACWPWQAGRNVYGAFWLDGKHRKAHRVAYMICVGDIPDGEGYHGMCVCHRCDNPLCCNPAHLFLGSNADNTADKMAKGRYVRVAGERHGSRTHPERVARGDRAASRRHPERLPRGERHHSAKLTDAAIPHIRAALARGEGRAALAVSHGVSYETIARIDRGESWAHVPSVVADQVAE